MKLKYIRSEYGFAIFDLGQTHSDMAKGMHRKPTSAGFVHIVPKGEYDVEAKCFGESVSLGLKSDEKDGEKITRQLNN